MQVVPVTLLPGRESFGRYVERLTGRAAFKRAGAKDDEAQARVVEGAEPVREGERIHGVVLHVDRYGNLITNIPGDWMPADGEVWLGFARAGPLRRSASAQWCRPTAHRSAIAACCFAGAATRSVRDPRLGTMFRASPAATAQRHVDLR